MVLLCNTFITETPPKIGKGFVFRENLSSYSNFDIFKYSLASLAKAYPWKRVILFIELDPIYEHRREELSNFIFHECFDYLAYPKDKEQNLILRWKRNEYQQDWKETYDLLNDDLIWFYCNHDHIFWDNTQDYLKELVDEMRGEKMCSLAFSHWPECIRTAKSGGTARPFDSKTYKIYDSYISVNNVSFDSIQIITKDLYHDWWFTGEFNHIKLPRPDYFGVGLAEVKQVPTHKQIIPLKELCRHFDGYQHCNPPILNSQCPAIEIPNGFFEGEIKIRYGYDDYKEGWVNINPTVKDYKATTPGGVDYKWILEDIPLFWKGRISEIDENPNIDKDLFIEKRMEAVMDMVNSYPSFTVDLEIINKIYKFSLLNTEYSI